MRHAKAANPYALIRMSPPPINIARSVSGGIRYHTSSWQFETLGAFGLPASVV
jgi:hypothetical protein